MTSLKERVTNESTEITTSEGSTPLSREELADLIPNLATKEELNEWERENILQARTWALRNRTPAKEIVCDEYVRRLHKKMFDQTWRWAGHYRRSDKNLGVPFSQILEKLGTLFGDVRYWMENHTYDPDEIAIRFHHRLALVHPFPNGNGRHGRLIADLLATRLGRPKFTWGFHNLVNPSETRKAYHEALRAADDRDIEPLLRFAKS